ncbi:MAG: hypothetical protein IK124_09710, partial [Prevotella sp.]|nr:hypothetical protein [Prevotella sp.]
LSQDQTLHCKNIFGTAVNKTAAACSVNSVAVSVNKKIRSKRQTSYSRSKKKESDGSHLYTRTPHNESKKT